MSVKYNLIPFLFYLFFVTKSLAQFSFDTILSKKPILKTVSADLKKYRVQIIYTQITRDSKGNPSFTTYKYHVDSTNYFYCASLVKLPCSILALEKINSLSNYGIDKNTTMFTDSANACQHKVVMDTTAENRLPSIAQYIKKMLIVSDNVAFGRAYEFLGVDYIHQRLAVLGYKNIRITHRFDGGCKGTEHLITNPISFYKTDKIVYHQPQQISSLTYTNPIGVVKIGKAHFNSQNKKINEPKDFTNMNYISLQNIHSLLQRLIFNQYLPKDLQFNISKEDQSFLIKHLSMYPRESSHPTYPIKWFHDSYKKYFIYGDSKKTITDTTIKVTNIVGQSYGFMIDCAYITNKIKNIEFMLSAVIYTNENEIINDGKYEYNSIALPFLAELGRQVYQYQLKK